MSPRWKTVAIGLGLMALTWWVFGQTLSFDFVGYDDAHYVTENTAINRGLTTSGLIWAFTQIHAANWHPLTWISHMIDCQLFGLSPAGHHFTNVLLHSIAVLLLFFVLKSMTNNAGRSAVVAALFAVHPLHVESVAWVAERKDVLSGVFFMATLGTYAWYTRTRSIGHYILVCAAFACGLMAKPMLVSMPIVLLLVDFWPLRRLEKQTFWKCVLEKIPLGVMAFGSCVITLFAQRDAIFPAEALPFWSRAALAPISLLTYLRQTLWPTRLAVFYPLSPADVWLMLGAGAFVLVAAISVVVIVAGKHYPYLLTGWFWFVTMLLPVCGLIQVGSQAHADRYTYLPYIGLFIGATWLLDALATAAKIPNIARVAAAAIIMSICASLGWQQCHYWQNGETLWEHTLSVTSNNAVAHNNYALALGKVGRDDEAIAHLQNAIAIRSSYEHAQYNLGNALRNRGQIDTAIEHYRLALAAVPDFVPAMTNLGNALLEKNETTAAAELYKKAIALNPREAINHYNFAVALDRSGQTEAAIREYEQAVALTPLDVDAQQNLGDALHRIGNQSEAEKHWREAEKLRARAEDSSKTGR